MGFTRWSIWTATSKELTSRPPATREIRRNRNEKSATCSPRLSDVTVRGIVASAAPPHVFHNPLRGARLCVRVAACSWKLFSRTFGTEVAGSVARRSHHSRTRPYGVTWDSNTERRIIAVEAGSKLRTFLLFSSGEGVCHQTRDQATFGVTLATRPR